MERFIHRQNLSRYRKLLTETKDETQRQVILKLLAEEQAKDPTAGEDETIYFSGFKL